MKKLYRKLVSGVLLSVLLFTAASCAAKNEGTKEPNGTGSVTNTETVSYKATLSAQEIAAFPDAFVNGMNQYGWNTAANLYSGKNLAISPASLALAILMTRTGAVGATADEMKNALSLSSLSDEDILSSCKQLMWRANTNGMEAANSIWMQKDYSFADAFIQSCTDRFMADAFSVNFLTDAPAATNAINKWASDKTHGKIPEMNPDPLPDDTRLVLINALYFLGDWEIPFTAANSFDEVFHGTTEDSTVKFMHDKRKMLYSETPAYQMISLPFKGAEGKADSPYSMAFILPSKGQDIAALMNDLSSKGFSSFAADLSKEKVQLSLPKYEFTFDASMVKTMQSLGMKLAFDGEKAQFDGMTEAANDLYITDILHKCYIRVDEKGAEAAAVTEVMVGETAAPVEDNLKNFTADRPFLFAIYDETDNTVLFLGAVGQL